ncbi:hypothetical protein NP493_660g05027 [Ridgeia piscesae]|uniref:Serpin domain-containing protein n=1 Tax=Ridgeia piscesae TaxID=27915 RepID=A0AAD9NR85_RIDPI|nr:hypothetical protein NP493_660g05027 [Ridgeia piscesae]
MAVAKAVLLLGVVLLGLSRPGLSLTATKQVVAANNDFAMDLYGQIRSNSAGENIFFSSFSVSSALAMVYAGAKGNTKTEMGNVLKLNSISTSKVHAGFRQIFKAFNDPTNNYTLSVANAFFGRKGYPFLNSYLTVVSQNYYALVKDMDFAGKTENSRLYINTWVENHTNKKITNLFPKGSIQRTTAAVLVNTIYFKGLWKTQFDVKDTTSSTFHLTTTKTMKTNMMTYPVAKRFNYAEVSSLRCKILELPYVGDEVSMYILLPNSINGLAALESQLTSAKLNNAISRMYSTKVDVSIPKFKMTLKVVLNNMLRSLGIEDLFVPNKADLSGMDGTRNLYVTQVIHKAYVDVNEEGTEAAAATGVVVGITSVGPRSKIFNADHPFLFFIREKVTGSILFSGRVIKPPTATGASSGTGTGSGSRLSWCKHLPKWLCRLLQWLGQRRTGRKHH